MASVWRLQPVIHAVGQKMAEDFAIKCHFSSICYACPLADCGISHSHMMSVLPEPITKTETLWLIETVIIPPAFMQTGIISLRLSVCLFVCSFVRTSFVSGICVKVLL